MTTLTYEEEFLIEGLRDDLDLLWAVSVVSPEDNTSHFEDDRAAAIGLVTVLLLQRKVEAIERVRGEWQRVEADPGEVAMRMARRWLKEWPAENPTPGALGWLRNTPKGDEIAKAAEAREER